MTREQALAIWALLGAANPGHQLSEEQLEIRAELILDLDFDLTKRAAVRLARESRWVPGVAELVAAVIQPNVPSADAIIAELTRLVDERGWPRPPSPDDVSHPAVWDALQAMGGWMSFCEGDERVNRAHLLKLCPPIVERHIRTALADPNAAIALEDRRRELERGN